MNRFSIEALRSVTAGALLVTLISLPSDAQEKRATLQELTRKSELVAVGKVREKRSGWDAKRSAIETTITIEVQDLLKGSSSGTIDIVTPGGEVGGVGEYYSHAAQFVKDEDVVVFAVRDRENRFRVAGGSSGKETITTDPVTGERIVGGKKRLLDFSNEVKNAGRGN